MATRVPLAPGEFYHIYNRGVDKRDIFMDDADHFRFLVLLYVSNSQDPVHFQNRIRTTTELIDEPILEDERLIDVCAYCLMPNHFHLLIKEKEDGGISKFMQKLSTAYTMYFNKRYERSGALFQSKFKSSYASTDRYLKYLISYIHLNPVKLIDPKWKENGIKNKQKAETYLDTYQYSSYADFLGRTRKWSKLITRDALPAYFAGPRSFKSELRDWLNFKEDFSK